MPMMCISWAIRMGWTQGWIGVQNGSCLAPFTTRPVAQNLRDVTSKQAFTMEPLRLPRPLCTDGTA